jgi:hypothetical protein
MHSRRAGGKDIDRTISATAQVGVKRNVTTSPSRTS